MNKHWVNYHTHKMFTNSIIADSPAKYEDYINRVLELGQTVITSVEHGFQGNYWLLNEMIRTKNTKFFLTMHYLFFFQSETAVKIKSQSRKKHIIK